MLFRLTNLELLLRFGSNARRVHIKSLEGHIARCGCCTAYPLQRFPWTIGNIAVCVHRAAWHRDKSGLLHISDWPWLCKQVLFYHVYKPVQKKQWPRTVEKQYI